MILLIDFVRCCFVVFWERLTFLGRARVPEKNIQKKNSLIFQVFQIEFPDYPGSNELTRSSNFHTKVFLATKKYIVCAIEWLCGVFNHV